MTTVIDRRGLAKRIRETLGPTILDIDEIVDGEFLKRDGSLIKSAAAGGGGALEWIETQVLGSSETDVTFSDLDGDVDVCYVLHGYVVPSGGSAEWMALRVNGSSDDSNHYGMFNLSQGGGFGAGNNAFIGLGHVTGMSNDNPHFFHFKFFAKSGKRRMGSGIWLDANSIYLGLAGGVWQNSADNITSLTIHSRTASHLTAGSVFSLYKMPNG